MNVKQLRLIGGCYALQMKDNIVASDTQKIELIGSGNFLVRQGNHIVFLPAAQVHFAVCEPDDFKKK